MLKNEQINLKVVEQVALALEEINEEVIFIGGAVVSLYATDKGAEQPRPTSDIDVSVQIGSYSGMELLRNKLAAKKIFPASSEKVIYRYIYQEITIDFIPVEDTQLGPTNRWLKPGFKKALTIKINETPIRILPVGLFLATKWEAYKNRGSDPRTSHDFEDIIYVIDNNMNLIDEISHADPYVKVYLKEMGREILSNPSVNEIIECHINPYIAVERAQRVIGKLKQILSLE